MCWEGGLNLEMRVQDTPQFFFILFSQTHKREYMKEKNLNNKHKIKTKSIGSLVKMILAKMLHLVDWSHMLKWKAEQQSFIGPSQTSRWVSVNWDTQHSPSLFPE